MNQANTVLVVGADGMIGRTLAERFAAAGRSVVRTAFLPTPGALPFDLARQAADWTPPSAATAFLCAAITSQEQCRTHRAESRAVNIDGTLALAEKLVRQGTHVIFPSTNLVLDGRTPRQSADAPYAPQTEYGRQKAEAEQHLRQLSGTCVVRFTKVFAAATPILVRWAAALQRGEAIRPFSDMPLAPLPLDFAVEALVAVAAARAEGIVQASADNDITYADAARFVANSLACAAELVHPVSVANSGMAIEYVPAHTTLDATRLQREFGLSPPAAWAAITLGMKP
jgi:dTDP-4-dehydrorhamnose reductase